MGATSEHFSESELACSCCGVNDCGPDLLEMLEWLRAAFEAQFGMGRAKIGVDSAFRCAKRNKKVGGAAGSQHPMGNAADFKVYVLQDRGKGKQEWQVVNCRTVEAELRKHPKLGGIGVKPSTHMVHADVRPKLGGRVAQWCYDATGKRVKYFPA